MGDRLITAWMTLPTAEQWLYTGSLCLGLALMILPVGYGIGFLYLERVRSPRTWIQISLITLAMPAIAEEVIFRVLLLPHPTEHASFGAIGLWSVLSLGLFVVYHPLNARFFYPPGRPTFYQPSFLGLATILGIACTVAYLQTGSLWLPVLLHWAAVVLWLLLLGGYQTLHGPTDEHRGNTALPDITLPDTALPDTALPDKDKGN